MEFLVDSALMIGSNEFYRAVRYDIPLVIILVNSEDRKSFDKIEASIRQTDIIQQLDPEITIIFLTHTTLNEANQFIAKMNETFVFTYTMNKFNDYERKFLEKLFEENEKKIVH